MTYNHSSTFIKALLIVLIITSMVAAWAEDFVPPSVIPIPPGNYIGGSDRAERDAAYQLDEIAYGHSATRKGRWYEREYLRHTASTNSYQITRTPITNGDYARFLKETGHPPPRIDSKTWKGYGFIHPYPRTQKFSWTSSIPPVGRELHPVVLVSHNDAVSYAKWLSEKTGKTWRLPTEAEWEKAARGTDGRRFPWGDAFEPARLNSHDEGPFDTMAVSSFPNGASPFGLIDASGQVFEWTLTEAQSGRYIVKGGSWDDKGCGVCRPAARHSRLAHIKHILIGFRLVCEVC